MLSLVAFTASPPPPAAAAVARAAGGRRSACFGGGFPGAAARCKRPSPRGGGGVRQRQQELREQKRGAGREPGVGETSCHFLYFYLDDTSLDLQVHLTRVRRLIIFLIITICFYLSYIIIAFFSCGIGNIVHVNKQAINTSKAQ